MGGVGGRKPVTRSALSSRYLGKSGHLLRSGKQKCWILTQIWCVLNVTIYWSDGPFFNAVDLSLVVVKPFENALEQLSLEKKNA